MGITEMTIYIDALNITYRP